MFFKQAYNYVVTKGVESADYLLYVATVKTMLCTKDLPFLLVLLEMSKTQSEVLVGLTVQTFLVVVTGYRIGAIASGMIKTPGLSTDFLKELYDDQNTKCIRKFTLYDYTRPYLNSTNLYCTIKIGTLIATNVFGVAVAQVPVETIEKVLPVAAASE
jgi:hypothetical protein